MSIIHKVLGHDVGKSKRLEARYVQILREDAVGVEHGDDVASELQAIVAELGMDMNQVRADAGFLFELYGEFVAAADDRAARDEQTKTREGYEAAVAEHRRVMEESDKRMKKAQLANNEAIHRVEQASDALRKVSNLTPTRPTLATAETIAFFREKVRAQTNN